MEERDQEISETEGGTSGSRTAKAEGRLERSQNRDGVWIRGKRDKGRGTKCTKGREETRKQRTENRG